MGELVNNLGNVAAFQNQIYPNGIDLGRSVYQQDLGILEADPNATFLAGMLVSRATSTGLIATSTGTDFFGVAKWNKANTLYGVIIDEADVAVTGTAVNFANANVSNVKLASVAGYNGSNGTLYVLGTDYTLNTTNGQFTALSGGAITNGQAVYATYTFALTNTALQFQGRNFWNFTDDVTIQDGRITIITDWSIIFTTQYDTSQVYTLSGLTSNLYAAGVVTTANQGKFTSSTTDGGAFVGRVFQAPSAGDPYLGVLFTANPVQVQTSPSAGGVGQITA